MSDCAATAERREQMLGELAEWLHAAAREARTRLQETETPADFATYNNALHKLGRGLRQTLALQARFETERLAGERQQRIQAETAAREARSSKKGKILGAIERLVWTEHEDFDEDDVEAYMDDVVLRLDTLAEAPDFLATPDAPLIAQLCEAFGLPIPDPIAQALAAVAAERAPADTS